MNQHFFARTASITLGMCIIAWLAVFCISFAGEETAGSGSAHVLTPAPGTSLRKAILDALRQEVKRIQGIEVVFVVKYLKVKDGWAWTHTLPQSPDGVNRYEDISALLNIQDGIWKVVEIPCMEIDNPDCIDGPGYFEGLKKRFPKIPTEILPVFG